MLFANRNQAQLALAQGWRWPHFTIAELACRCAGRFCAGEYWHNQDFLDRLEAMRAHIGQALVIGSGHRCSLWNAVVGGAPLSRHKHIAADLSLHGQDRFALLEAARASGFTGLGLARSFLHVDRRTKPALWYYTGSRKLWQI